MTFANRFELSLSDYNPITTRSSDGNVTKITSKGFRVAPFGNRGANLNNGAPNWAARLPHVHFRAPAVKSSTARTGMKWHRPWQTTFRKWFK